MRRLILTALTLAILPAFSGFAEANDGELCEKGSGDAAIDACTRLIQSKHYTGRDLAWPYLARGVKYAGLGDLDRALADFSEAIRLDPTSKAAFNNRGFIYSRKNNLDLALGDFNEAIRLDPKYANALNQRCWLRATAGKELTLALADCDRSLALRPNHAGTLDSRGLVHFRLGRFDQAIADLNAALEINPRQEASLYVRGLAKLKKGDTTGGNADIAEAERIDPKVTERYAKWGVRR